MLIAVLQFELLIHDAHSIKDKRRVVKSVKDRLHREHMVSVAEIAALENPALAVMGLTLVSNSARHAGSVLDKIIHKLRALHDAELGELRREILRGSHIAEEPWDGPDEDSAPPDAAADPDAGAAADPARIHKGGAS